MRRTASEIINDLETRIARLEGKTARGGLTRVAKTFLSELSQGRHLRVSVRDVEEALVDFLETEFEELFEDGEDVRNADVRIRKINRVTVGDMYEDASLTAFISVNGALGLDPAVEIDFVIKNDTTPTFFLAP